MKHTHSHARLLRFAAAMTTAALAASLPLRPAAAEPTHLDPATLARGAAPAVPVLVRDVIKDGPARVPATKKGQHEGLWAVDGGYLIRDFNVGPRRVIRVVFVDSTGERRVVSRSRSWISVAVSASGRRIAVQRSLGSLGERSVITVSRARTGVALGERTVRLATLAAVTDHRVLLGLRARWHDPATVWWNLDRDTVRHLYDEAALSADVPHDKVVFERSTVAEFCNRVAVLSRPSRTLWRSCRLVPHEWSPNGAHAVGPPTYFDAPGTDRWWVVNGRTGDRTARITGRLDWHATWEDNHHFLTLALGDTGKAAIIRCDLSGTCERASRLWNVPVPTDLYYAGPPVVLAGR